MSKGFSSIGIAEYLRVHGIFDLSYLHVDEFRMVLGFWLVTSWHFGQPMLKKDDGRWLLRVTQNVSRVFWRFGIFQSCFSQYPSSFSPEPRGGWEAYLLRAGLS